MSMMSEFKEFALKGNVMDLAVGVIIGGAFGKIVDSLVGDVIMPVISKIFGGLDFSNYFIPLAGQTETVLTLPPGKHTLQLLLGDHSHVPHEPVVASDVITITVE